VDRFAFVQGHHLGDPVGVHTERPAKEQRQHRYERDHRDDRDGRQMYQKVVERQVRSAADDDVRGIADQCRHTADVGCQHFRDEKRNRVDVEAIAHQQRHRRHEQHDGHVGQDRRRCGGDENEKNHDPQRRSAGTLCRPDRRVLETTRLAEHADDDHRAQEQKDDVPVDSGLAGVEHVLGADDPQREHNRRAAECDLDLVNALGRDEGVGGDEND
jgi:hypothetical protein